MSHCNPRKLVHFHKVYSQCLLAILFKISLRNCFNLWGNQLLVWTCQFWYEISSRTFRGTRPNKFVYVFFSAHFFLKKHINLPWNFPWKTVMYFSYQKIHKCFTKEHINLPWNFLWKMVTHFSANFLLKNTYINLKLPWKMVMHFSAHLLIKFSVKKMELMILRRNPFPNPVTLNKILIVITLFRLIWHQT